MSLTVPEKYKDLLERPVVITLATVSGDGRPFATPIWRWFDGTHIQISTTPNIRKHKNVLANPHVTTVAIDPDNPYRYLEVPGVVEVITEEGALELLDRLTMLYMGKPHYYGVIEAEEKAPEYEGVLFKSGWQRALAAIAPLAPLPGDQVD